MFEQNHTGCKRSVNGSPCFVFNFKAASEGSYFARGSWTSEGRGVESFHPAACSVLDSLPTSCDEPWNWKVMVVLILQNSFPPLHFKANTSNRLRPNHVWYRLLLSFPASSNAIKQAQGPSVFIEPLMSTNGSGFTFLPNLKLSMDAWVTVLKSGYLTTNLFIFYCRKSDSIFWLFKAAGSIVVYALGHCIKMSQTLLYFMVLLAPLLHFP